MKQKRIRQVFKEAQWSVYILLHEDEVVITIKPLDEKKFAVVKPHMIHALSVLNLYPIKATRQALVRKLREEGHQVYSERRLIHIV